MALEFGTDSSSGIVAVAFEGHLEGHGRRVRLEFLGADGGYSYSAAATLEFRTYTSLVAAALKVHVVVVVASALSLGDAIFGIGRAVVQERIRVF